MASHADPKPTSANPPVLPPGFRTEIEFHHERKLSPKGVFLAVVYMMAELTRRPWDGFIQHTEFMKLSGVAVLITPDTPSLLRVSHAVLGLNAAVVAAVQERLFFLCSLSISSYETYVGNVQFVPSSHFPDGDQNIGDGPESNLTTSPMSGKGTLTDPQNKKFQVHYAFDGRKISSKDMFTAVLDGLANLAQFDPFQRFETLNAVGPLSPTGQAVIFIREVSSRRGVINNDVTSALLMIFGDLNVAENKFGEMDFDVSWNGEKIATGYVMRLDPPFTGGGATA